MIQLIQKRHSDKGWAFFTELANGTGGNIRGRADAFAVGIWPSRGFEAHCYEIKISREDMKKELSDPTKADMVGKYADFFWLVVYDLKVIDTLVIPERWGILTRSTNGKVLRVVRKAPKQEAAPWSRGFCAALIRHVYDNHTPNKDVAAIREELAKELRPRLQGEATWAQRQIEQQFNDLRKRVAEFSAVSGIDLDANHWRLGDIGAAVKLVVDARLRDQGQASYFERVAEAHERVAAAARKAAATLHASGREEDVQEPTQAGCEVLE